MNKLILIVVVMLMQLMGASDEANIFIKAKQVGDIVEVKTLIKHQMMGNESYGKRRNIDENFISHITAEVEDKIVLDISTSPYLSKNPRIEYKFKDINQSSILKYTLTDNKSNQKEYSTDIKRTTDSDKSTNKLIAIKKDSIVNYRKLRPKAWESLKIEEAVVELYGSIKSPIEGRISLSGPETSYCEEMIPVYISSDADLESLAIFIDKIEKPTVAVFSIPKNTMIDISLVGIKIYKACTDYSVLVIGKGRDGKFYKTSSKGRIACADSCGGGG